MMRVLILAPLLLASLVSAEKKNVLWIGNSFSWYVPERANIIAGEGGHEINIGAMTFAGWKWSQHASSQDSLDSISNHPNHPNDPWDIVVLQEQSQIPSFGSGYQCDNSVPYLDILVETVRAHNPNARVFLYQTWGYPHGDSGNGHPDYESMQEDLTRSYNTHACTHLPAEVIPVGEVFRRIKETQGEDFFLSLFKSHGGDTHPDNYGRWLSALTFYVSIFDTMAVENPADLGIEPAIATMLKETVDSVWELGLPWKYEADSQCDLCMCNC